MSETISKDGINIEINNSDSNQGGDGGGFLDRIFNLGLRLLVPLLLVFAVFSIIVFFGVVLPLLQDISGVIGDIADVSSICRAFKRRCCRIRCIVWGIEWEAMNWHTKLNRVNVLKQKNWELQSSHQNLKTKRLMFSRKGKKSPL